MSVLSYIQAIPKVELVLSLEGAMQRNSLLKIAEANDIPETLKHYNDWVSLLKTPDYKRVNDIAFMASSWLQIADDLTRVVYDVGVFLSKQNVVYAEIAVNPTLYEGIGLSFEDFLNAINGGRDRAKRAWNVDMAWILIVPREEPRRADDYARAVTTLSARRNGIVGLGLSGKEGSQPVGQFERAFRTAEKKGVPRIARAGDALGAEGVLATIDALAPSRIIDARGVTESPEALTKIEEQQITIGASLTRAQKQGWVADIAEYPLRALVDAGVRLVLGTDMPAFYQNTLVDEYMAAVEKGGLSLDELDNIALNAVRASFLPDEDKAAMLERFQNDYARLREEHVTSGEAV